MTEIVQGSPEWFDIRRGFISASRIKDMMATTKSGESASRANYRAQLVAERMTGINEESYTNAAMQWGIDNEPIARGMYEIATEVLVEECGFILHPSIKRSGASPDGLVGDDGLLEIKCPNTSTHIKYLLTGKPPPEYVPQMAWQCACTSRKWADFVSFDPRMEKPDQLFLVRYTPEPEYLKMLEVEVVKFDTEIEELRIEIIKRRKQ